MDNSTGEIVHFGSPNYDWGRSAYLRDPNGMLVEMF